MMQKHINLLLVVRYCWLVSSLWTSPVSGEITGAPEAACSTMTPVHGVVTQDPATSPFTITLSQDNYQPGDAIEVSVSGTGNFKGFLMMARHSSDDNGNPVGKFTTSSGMRLECATKPLGNAITHSNIDAKDSLTLTWTAPSSAEGPLKFWLTIVRDYNTFWVGVTSSVLDGDGGASTGGPQEQPEIPAFSTADCKESKSCIKGNLFVSWQYEEASKTVKFEMSANTNGYLALGFSEDKKMGSDSVVACAADNDNIVSVYNSYNTDETNAALQNRDLGLAETNGWYDGTTLRCSFTRDVSSDEDGQFFDISEKMYYLLLATGPSTGLGGIQQHDDLPEISEAVMNLTDNTISASAKSSDVLLVKIHACLMLTAWVLSASTGIILARYFKNAWADTTIFKLKVWFQFHRACMVSALLLHLAGFVVIFVHVTDFTEAPEDPKYLQAHPLMGIILTGLVILNPTMALFRCHPGTRNRPYFDWAHWLVGNTAHITAVVVIFLGMQFPSSKEFAEDWLMWLMVAFVAVHVLTEIVLEVNSCSAQPSITKKDQYGDMDKTGNSLLIFEETRKNALYLQYWVLAAYLLIVTGLLAAMIVFIWVEI